MKRLGLVLILVLAACSGGGGSPGAPPTAAPTATPVPLVYTAKLMWTGLLAGNPLHAATAGKTVASALDGGSILTISGTSSINGDPGDNPVAAIVQAVVSPAPSASPAIAYSTDSSVLAIVATPVPVGSASPQPPSVEVVPSPNSSEHGKSIVATVGPPVNTAATLNTITYRSMTLACGTPFADENTAGVRWDASTSAWVNEPDPALADFYMTYNAANCGAGYYTPGVNAAANYPGGGKWFSSAYSFDGFATTDWGNTGTSESIVNFGVVNPDGSYPEATLIFKTRSGLYAKAIHLQLGGGFWTWGYEIAGQGLDSF